MESNLESDTPGVEAIVGGVDPCSREETSSTNTSVGDPVQNLAVSDAALLPTILRDFLAKQRAEVRNFRRADITQMVDRYPKPVGTYLFSAKDGLSAKGEAEMPDEATTIAINGALREAALPKPVTMTAIADPPPGVNLSDPKVFICHDLKGEVAMIHQRYDTKDGGKGFIPWTRWSDARWRKMEPEVMPFYGVPGGRDKTTLFIHEGAKAAKRMQRMIAGELPSDEFPWFEHMRYGHHIGWIGGVWALDRSDWEGLAAMGWRTVVIVADNEGAGVEVAAKATRFFRCPTFMLRFGEEYPARFDCGDPTPANLFDERGNYTGPSYQDCLQPYDRATDLVPIIGRNNQPREVPVLRPAFIASHCVATETQQVFNRAWPALAMGKKPFNDSVRPRSDAADTYGLLIQQPQCVCDARTYSPDRPSGQLTERGRMVWNAYAPSGIVLKAGDAGPFLAYLDHLFPIEAERFEVMRWIATLIARRDIRMHYSLLLISKMQGVGKSTLGVILAAILGEHNVSFPGQSAFENQFNSWANGRLLVFVNEIYTNGNAKVYDHLKNFITDDEIEINEKHVTPYRIKNWSVIVACSNSRKALFLPDEDRRWLVPTVTEQLRDRSEWEALHTWLQNGGFEIIAGWAEEFARDHAVKRGERPPATAAKRAIVAENKSEGRLLARDFGEEFAGMYPAIVRVAEIRAWIADKRDIDLGHANLEKERLIIDELEAVEGLTIWKGDARPKIGGRRGDKAAVVFNFTPEPGAMWGQVEDRLTDLKTLGFYPQTQGGAIA